MTDMGPDRPGIGIDDKSAAGRDGHHPFAIGVLKGLIVLFGLICVWMQYGLVVMSGDIASLYPETAPARWPYAIAGVLGVACFEAAMIPLWNLLTLAKRRDVFSGRAVPWVDAIIGCAAVEGALVLFVLLFGEFADFRYCDLANGLCFRASMTMPIVALGCVVGLLLIAAFILLMLVMRSLLKAAIAQRDELAEVI